MKKLKTLTPTELAAKLKRRAGNRTVSRADQYLCVYDDLRRGIQAIRPLNRRNVILIAHCVFGWMPTQLKINRKLIDRSTRILSRAGNGLNAAELGTLARTFQTSRGKSVVAAAKILHFIFPDKYPIWDKHIAKQWGTPSNGKRAARNCLAFTDALNNAINLRGGAEACAIMRNRLSRAGFVQKLTDLRVAELIVFQGPR